MNDSTGSIEVRRCDSCTERHCNGCENNSHYKCEFKLNINPAWFENLRTGYRRSTHEEHRRHLHLEWIGDREESGMYVRTDPAERIEFPDEGVTIRGQRTLRRQNGSDNGE